MLRPGLPVFAAVLWLFAAPSRAETIQVSNLDLHYIEWEYGQPGVNVSVEKHPLSIAGHAFQSGASAPTPTANPGSI